MAVADAHRPSPARLWFLRFASALMPLVVLALLEGALRLLGYGDDYALFVESAESDRYLMPNPDVVTRYFADGFAPALSIETNYFLKDKPEGALRLFVQGGSTAAGFPFGNDASIAGMLGARLRQRFPERTVEVVNTAMSAVTSYTLLDFADEIIAEEPDAVLIYAGHNEYVGIFGVGSAYAPTGWRPITLLLLELDRLRLFQLLRNLYVQARLLVDEPDADGATTLMAAIARDRHIAFGSARYRQGIAQFDANVARLADKYRTAGIPVFVATIASNLADQPPFVSSALPDEAARLLATARTAADLESDAGAGANAIGDDAAGPDRAALIGRVTALARTYQSADLDYVAAALLARQADFEAAKQHYVNARDLDQLRFRAPSAINETIRAIAADRGLTLVDVNAALESKAEHGLIGRGLMLEHLHPNAEGYALIADAFYASLDASGLLGQDRRPAQSIQPDELPLLPAEIYFAAAATAQLTSDFPFVATRHEPVLPPIVTASDEIGYRLYAGSLTWLGAAEASRRLASDPDARALASTLIAESLPFRADLNARAGTDLLDAGRPAESLRYLKRAIDASPDRADYRLQLADGYRRLDRRDEALAWIDTVLALDPGNAAAIAARRQSLGP